MKDLKMDFYSSTNLKSYNLNESMRYQLAVLDSLDVFTRLHSENVANLTCRICEYMHMKDYFTIYCTMCAYLHDIGKQFIPSQILQKNGPLTDEEYEKMKTHTTIGYEMCLRDEKLRPYSAGALYHHEALNGTGYPKGLTVNDIPLVGQIIRVADEFDAITSRRQYKTHIGVCDTLEILIEHSQPDPKINKRFGKVSPKIVKALIKVIIEDTEYECYSLDLYIQYLKDEIKRLKQIDNYKNKMDNTNNEKTKGYYLCGLKELLQTGETLENYMQVLVEFKQAYETRINELATLKQELKEIKKLKV